LIEVNALVEDAQLTLNWTFNPAIHQPTTVQQLADDYVAALERLVAWCDSAESTFTPSDFDLLTLDQPELDRIAALLRQLESLPTD
jgi:non-ribosomal peptide synthase protein (TIGR01720 family)